MVAFPAGAHDDQVDATAGAFANLGVPTGASLIATW
jgi:phage terminase large subunit-like protein